LAAYRIALVDHEEEAVAEAADEGWVQLVQPLQQRCLLAAGRGGVRGRRGRGDKERMSDVKTEIPV
jgi:hypothetical protein